MPTNQNIIAVIVNNEFQDQYFTNEKSFNEYVESVAGTGSEVKAMVVPFYQFKGLLKIQELVGVHPDFNTVMIEIERLDPDKKAMVYSNIGQINENAFSKEYFDYYVKNMLGLTSDPDFEPEFAEKDQTLSYVDYLKTQVAFLNEVIGMIEGNRTGATNASENIQ